jgi:predicted nucleic acid-binding protein
MDRVRGVPADASALIYIAKAGAFAEAVTILGSIEAPEAVWAEAVTSGQRRDIADTAIIVSAQEKGLVLRRSLSPTEDKAAHGLARTFGLGRGESQVLAIAGRGSRLLLDDRRAIRAAVALGLSPIATAALPAFGFREGRLEADPALAMLRRLGRVIALRAEILLTLEAVIREARE